MPRFFVSAGQIGPEQVLLTGENAAHARVLRLRPGDAVTLCDGRGLDYHCSVAQMDQDRLLLHVESSGPSASEAAVEASVYMAFAKGDKLEHVIQKATELGAAEIVGFPAERCVARFDEKTLQKKLPRWQKIAAAAAEQSGRGVIPRVLTLPSCRAAMERAAEADKALLFYENEQAHTLSQALSVPFRTVALMTGPEGGLTPQEVETARNAGMEICTLGRRILRCETAPLCALSAVMFAAGEY